LLFARNRVRHRVLPELLKLNPEITTAIARLADAAAGVADIAAEHAAATLDRVSSQDAVALDRLPSQNDARADALALWWERRTGQRLAARHRSALARLAASMNGSRSLDLPGGRALREYATLRIGARGENIDKDGPITVERGGTADWHGWRFAFVVEMDGSSQIGHVDAERVVVRGRRPGDRMNGPRGAKVQDLFTDAKVPARARDRWPLVVADDKVVWIPGITPPPLAGRFALQALRIGEDSSEMTLDNRQQVASLREERPPGEERGRPRT
jgi:tRNA(Ile)-lysidine synthase